MSKDRLQLSLTMALTFVTISAIFLNSSVFATDTSQDNVAVSVPVSCSMSGTGMNSHNASIPNGTYQDNIGTTTVQVLCNDNEGFAIYAIGYTNDEHGNNYLVDGNTSTSIVTGTETSGNTSNWAMKLATDSSATYPLEIESGFDDYTEVPADYELVAYRDSGTDLGTSAVDASFTTTYAAFIDKTQTTGTYNGQVKYTLVHPLSADIPYPSTEIDLEVIKTVEGHTLDDEIVYAITVTNIGDYDAKDVVISIQELEEQFTIETLLPGASQVFTPSQFIREPDMAAGFATLTVDAAGSNTNTITITVITPVEDGPPIIDDDN